jgi:lysophospholipase L1-like esterase
MRRTFAIVCLLGLLAAPVAAADSAPTEVRLGRVVATPPVDGRSSLLVSARYPIELTGHRVRLHVSVFRGIPGIEDQVVRPLLSAGPQRSPERRRGFSFVHRIDLSRALTAELGKGALMMVEASAALDANSDGKAKLHSKDYALQELRSSPGKPTLCSSMPLRRVRPGGSVAIRPPVCSSTWDRWKISTGPEHGQARIQDGVLLYRSAKRFRGSDSIALQALPPVGTQPASLEPPAPTVVSVKVGTDPSISVRAIGDSVTAGFGYYDNGTLMGLFHLPECKPGSVTLVDPCSSNSATVNNAAKKVEFAPDYGLANNVSWAAQWANEYGITNFENLAISGAEPGQWAPGGPLYPLTKQVEAEDPDYILMTVGANPLLAETLFGVENMACAVYADIFGRYKTCIEEAFAGVQLHENLESLYRNLVQNTTSTIYLMQYHLSIPASALAYTAIQIAEIAKMMNEEIAAAAAAVNPKRLQVVAPPHFNVGVDLEPVYPSKYSCSRAGYKVDGPSVQIKATQDELLLAHPLSFCKGPVTGPPWVISGDTGIHPSASGYAQMASQVPAPE